MKKIYNGIVAFHRASLGIFNRPPTPFSFFILFFYFPFYIVFLILTLPFRLISFVISVIKTPKEYTFIVDMRRNYQTLQLKDQNKSKPTKGELSLSSQNEAGRLSETK